MVTKLQRSIRTTGILGLATLAIIASSRITIHVGPVPIAIQPLIVFWVGTCIEPRLALATTIFWLILGASGAPVFPDGGSGIHTLLGLNGGYLVSLVPAAVALSFAARRGLFKHFGSTLAAFSVASAGVVGIGASRLALSVGVGSAWNLGVKPFFVGTVLKTVIGALAVNALRWLIEQARRRRWRDNQPMA